MSTPSWYNENENRAYPFVPGGRLPPPGLVVDAGFVAGPKSRFETGRHAVRLTAVRRLGRTFYLDFAGDAPELFGVTLTFARPADAADFSVVSADSGMTGLSASSLSGGDDDRPQECDEPLWWGYLVTGRSAAFAGLLPADGRADFDAVIEPALVQNLAGAYVVKFGVANDDRTRVTPPDGCGPAVPSRPTPYVVANCVVGDVVFVPGHNAVVRQNPVDRSVVFGAAVGAGAGEPCGPVPLYPGESPPPGSSLLEGGPRCDETVRAVNGLGGPQVTIVAGPGVTVTPRPEEHKVIVHVHLSGVATPAGLV